MRVYFKMDGVSVIRLSVVHWHLTPGAVESSGAHVHQVEHLTFCCKNAKHVKDFMDAWSWTTLEFPSMAAIVDSEMWSKSLGYDPGLCNCR
jgi:hypothetical protein